MGWVGKMCSLVGGRMAGVRGACGSGDPKATAEGGWMGGWVGRDVRVAGGSCVERPVRPGSPLLPPPLLALITS